ncbi:finTRIM family, member 86 [Synchiropus splendidus]|uniref:finTRIM family, member 86 n=1 Tax=Synchiropus splendidus TaxID=270530 RepID=UPI00237E64A2|nr:finTRIM family, member 86 [Synchiropus splendidus]XP_053729618.1 finTRIM family, member 86 [Synchiropus splendidus]
MASAWSEEETFVCSVCLETMKDPATLPCGHSYCLACIQHHWDNGGGEGQCSCPQCRQVFNPRPSLAKSTVLVEAMEKLRSNSLKLNYAGGSSTLPSMPTYLEVLPGTQQGSVYPQLPSVAPRPCPKHDRPLDLFCRDDRECVCEECRQDGHQGHSVLTPEDERKEKQKELLQTLMEAQRKAQETERELAELPHVARQYQASFQGLQREKHDLFTDLTNNMDDLGAKVNELLNSHEVAFGSQIESQIHRLQQKVVQLRWKNEELNRLAGMQDDVCFLKNFHMMEPQSQSDAAGESIFTKEQTVQESLRAALKELQESVGEIWKTTLTKITTILNEDAAVAPTLSNAAASTPAGAVNGLQPNRKNTVVYEMHNPPPQPPPRPLSQTDSLKPSPLQPAHSLASAPPAPLPPPHAPPPARVDHLNPEPKTRGELLKYRFEPSMDPNTAYRHLLLSDGDRKATMRAENVHPTDHPERFHFWRQVLCREPLGGSPYYWEVEWTGQKVTVGVAYKDMDRKTSDDKSRLGHNPKSWSLYWSGTGFSFWHNSEEKLLGLPKSKKIGVYLDQHTGVLAFYRITNNQADLIHRHQTEFTGPLYPGFRFSAGVGATVTVCQLD